MKNPEIKTASSNELSFRNKMLTLFSKCPIPKEELLANLPLFIKRQDLTRILFLNDLYQKILDVPGIIMEFGVRWGKDMAIYESLRGIYEPFNHSRKIIGFDTFQGFPFVHKKDGTSDVAKVKAYSVSKNYEEYLKEILDYHEEESPISHIKKYQLIKGDASREVVKYLNKNPETIIAFAYFDFDIYEPTKNCLQAIKEHLVKGSVIGFDELGVHYFPGETRALKEVLGLDKYKIRRNPYSSVQVYIIIE